MGETQDLSPDEAIEKSSELYRELNNSVEGKKEFEARAESRAVDVENARKGIRVLKSQSTKHAIKIGHVKQSEVDEAVMLLKKLKFSEARRYHSHVGAVDYYQDKERDALNEGQNHYQANKEAIQDAAVQDIGPENTSFGKSQQAEKDHDTQASN